MNAAEIRAEAIERVAKAMGRQSMPSAPGLDLVPAPIRAAIYQRAELAVDALGDLLPTETKTRWPKCTHEYVCPSSCGPQHRYVTDWHEAG